MQPPTPWQPPVRRCKQQPSPRCSAVGPVATRWRTLQRSANRHTDKAARARVRQARAMYRRRPSKRTRHGGHGAMGNRKGHVFASPKLVPCASPHRDTVQGLGTPDAIHGVISSRQQRHADCTLLPQRSGLGLSAVNGRRVLLPVYGHGRVPRSRLTFSRVVRIIHGKRRAEEVCPLPPEHLARAKPGSVKESGRTSCVPRC